MNKVLLLMGPTASGKTSLALSVAESIPIEIINVDSALIYQDLNIGSAKPSTQELSTVPHHLIDIVSPMDSYSVGSFVVDCKQAIDKIHANGKTPLLVGGTMMYYNALVNGLSVLPPSNPILKQTIEDELHRVGGRDKLYQELSLVDPRSLARININDTQRLVRAIEVYRLSGKAMSDFFIDNISVLDDYEYQAFAIIPSNRKILHDRISNRSSQMLQLGFIQEVQQLKLKYPNLNRDATSMRSVGYSQVWSYLAEECNEIELVELINAATRQLAKRQLTWLRSMKSCHVLDDELLSQQHLLQQILSEIKL